MINCDADSAPISNQSIMCEVSGVGSSALGDVFAAERSFVFCDALVRFLISIQVIPHRYDVLIEPAILSTVIAEFFKRYQAPDLRQ